MNNIPQQNSFEQIQSLCRDFRRQLRSGAQKRIEDYLDHIDEDSREMLFQNLLHIDIEFQRRQGREPASDDYLMRFPQHPGVIRQAFFESTQMSVDPAAETPTVKRTELEDVPAARRLGPYELVRQIGRGAFGAVYQAKHLLRGDTVALKLLPLSLDGNADASGDADRLHKFRREFRALSDVNHPNLVGMQSLEVDGRQWYFTMDLIEGIDFLEYVRPQGKLDISQLRSAARQLAEGLAALHQRRIIHRDLKPANVMVDHDGHVMILDFGLVIEERPRADFTVLMSKHGFAGTPLYAAPEQMFGDCDQASDLYAVGVMLFEALTGQHPFRGSGAEVMRAKSSSAAPPLSEQLDVPPDLAQLADDLLQRDPDQRPDAEAVLSRLSGTIDTESRDSTEALSATSGSESRLTLIGREQELQTLQSLHRQLQETNSPLAAFIRGRSGEGKTALADEFLHSLRTDYTSLVLSGRCYDRESVPFKAIDAVIDPLVLFLRSQQDDDVRRWLPDDIGSLAQLFPMLRRVTSISEVAPAVRETPDARQLRHRAFAALRDLLNSIGARTPVVLFIDDLQWGDADSATALRDVLQPPNAPAAMLLGTYRSDEAADSPFLQEWAGYKSMTDETLSQHDLEVGPLSEEQCLNLLALRLGTDAESVRQQAQELFAGTRGNPYFLDQLLEGVDPESGTIEAVPLAELIERRLGRLPPAARPLLDAIAVAGQAVALSEAASVAEQTAAAMSTVTHMRNERLVRLIGVGEESTVDTWHDKIRETVLADMPDGRKRQMHLAFAQLLESQSANKGAAADQRCDEGCVHPRVFDLAFHLFEAGDPRAFDYQLAAGESAIREYAMDTARDYLQAAERILPNDADSETRFRLFFALAEAWQGLEQIGQARHFYERAIPLAPTNMSEARCHYGIGGGLARQGDMCAAQVAIGRALALLGEQVPGTTVGTLLGVARTFFAFHAVPPKILRRMRGRKFDSEHDALAASIVNHAFYIYLTSALLQLYIILRGGIMGKRSLNEGAQATALAHYATIFSGNGILWLARPFLRQAERLCELAKSRTARAQTLHTIGANYLFHGQLDCAEQYLHDSLPELQRGRHYQAGMSWHWLRHIASVRGDARAIQRCAQEELRYGQATNDLSTLAYAEYGLADGLSRMGYCDQAIPLAERALERLENAGLITSAVAGQELGRALLQASQYETAIDTLRRNFRRIHLHRVYWEINMDTYPLYVEALLGAAWSSPSKKNAAARIALANQAAWRARWMCGRFPTLRPHAWRASGRAACAAGRTRKALKYFDEANRSAEQVGARYELARTVSS